METLENIIYENPVLGKPERKILNAKRKIIYLVNPFSGTKKKEAIIKVIDSISKMRELDYDITNTSPVGNYELLKERIREEKITDIIIIGGDGTVSNVIGALHTENVRFGIIPYGSGNGLALAAKIYKKPKTAFELILDEQAHMIRNIDAFFVNGRFSCMLCGLGFDAQVAHDFSTKTTRGLLTYTQQSIINYFKAQPYQFEVIVDGFSFFTDAYFITVANGNQFGHNFKIAPEADLSDGMLDVVIVQKMNKAKLPFAILRQIRGNNKLQQLVDDISHKNILYFRTSSLKIRNLKLAPLHIDGDPCETAEELDIQIKPNCFNLILPK